MRTIKFDRMFSPLSETELEVLEENLRIRLPQDYRDFLKATNGGQPAECNNYLGIENTIPGGNSDVAYFFNGVTVDDDELSLAHNVKLYRDRICSDLMPIAMDSFGNLILLKIQGERIGSIFFWDHEDELAIDGSQNEHNVYPIFSRFCDLLDGLREEPTE